MYVALLFEPGKHPNLVTRSHRFDESGGTVGRDPGCNWALPDARSIISGRHLLITFANGRFSVTDTSRNGVFLNGARTPIGQNNSHVLADGDRLRLGEYELVARIEGIPQGQNLGLGSGGGAPDGQHGQLIDPASSATRDADPLAHLAPVFRAAPASVPPLRAKPSRFGADEELSGLFDDNPGNSVTDSLIGSLRATARPLGVRPPDARPSDLAMTPFSPPAADTFVAAGLMPPQAIPVPQAPVPPAIPPASAAVGVPPAALIPDDWAPDFLRSGAPGKAVPLGRSPFLAPAPPVSAPVPAAPVPVAEMPPEPPIQDSAFLLKRREAARDGTRPAAPAASSGEDAEMLAILWQSLGVDPSRLSLQDRRRFMKELGLGVREMSEGLSGVLGMRQNLKSEFRVDHTMVSSIENNLFKFTRNADEMLALAITNANKVFLPLDRAVRGAFNDIKSHELAMLHAVQLSIRSLLDRFNPQKIEKQARDKRGSFSLGSTKAACWEFFSDSYNELAGDADEASNRIFATEFARAYRERTQKPTDA